MHDPVYRQSVAGENIAYNRPPHPSLHIGVGMELPGLPNVAGGQSCCGYVSAPIPGQPAASVRSQHD